MADLLLAPTRLYSRAVKGILRHYRVKQVVRLGGFIAAPAEFSQHALVMNGASNLAVEVFGDAGRHARTTVGVPSLPADVPVEVEGMFRIA